MRNRFSLVLVVAFMGLLSACTKAVLGPDLAQRPTPFVAEGAVDLSDSFGVVQATINAQPAGDTGTVHFSELGDKPYKAALTYRPFIPIIAESNTERKDYWLVALNLTRTKDRAFYAIMRYPHGKPLQPRATRDDFEFRLLDCGMQPKPEADEAAEPELTEDILKTDIPANLVTYQESDSLCLFERIEDVEEHANRILQQDDALRREAQADPEAGSVNRWSRLKVVAR